VTQLDVALYISRLVLLLRMYLMQRLHTLVMSCGLVLLVFPFIVALPVVAWWLPHCRF
jgi:hypothetical protein